MKSFISDKVLKLNEVFYATGCKFITDGKIRYFVPVKDNLSSVICDWTISLGTINGVEGTKYEKCVNITVNPECKSTIRIYTNVLKMAPPSPADAEIKYEVSHMTYSAISGATFELLYKMNEALIEQMREFLAKPVEQKKQEEKKIKEDKVKKISKSKTVKKNKTEKVEN